MSHKLPWGVAIGMTLLISVTGCSQQPGQPSASPTDACGILAAPVTAALVKNGITANPVNDATSSACRWQDAASATTVTLHATDASQASAATPTTSLPRVGDARIVGPGELAFTAGGRSWDLKVESSSPDDVDTQTATQVVSTIAGAVGGTPDQGTPDQGATDHQDAQPTDQPSGQQAGGTSGAACGAEPGFCITVDITGATTVQGATQTINSAATCADYAMGKASPEGLPFPGLLGEKIDGHDFTSTNMIGSAFTGPGTYDNDKLRSASGVINIVIDNATYLRAADTTAQAVIDPNGSGSFTFANLAEGEPGNPTGTISGSLTWTCRD